MVRGRAGFLAAFATIVFAIVALYARERWMVVVTLVVTDGAVVAGWVGSGWLLGRGVMRRVMGRGEAGESVGTTGSDFTGGTPVPPRSRALDVATAAGVGMGLIGLAALGLALAGGLNRWTSAALLLVGPAWAAPGFVRGVRAAREVRAAAWFGRPVGGRWVLLAAGPAVGMMVVGASIIPGALWRPEDPHPYDTLEYHLGAPKEWQDLGRMGQLRHNVYSYFPYGVEMHYLMAMHVRGGAWPAMFQCQFFSVAWAGLMGLAVYGAVRESGGGRGPGGRAVASAAAVLAVSVPWVVMLGAVAYTEDALAFYTAAAAGWVLRTMRSPGGRGRAMAVAGALAGLACGVKYTAVPMVVGALGGAAGLVAVLTRDVRQWWRPLIGFGVAAVVAFAPWLARNWAWTGNPVFPLAMKQLGPGHFDAEQVERFRVAHAPTAADAAIGARVRRAWGEVFGNWQYGYGFWVVVGVATVAGVVGVVRSRSRARGDLSAGAPPAEAGSPTEGWGRELALIVAFLAIVLVVWVGFTHLLGRFYVLCVPVAAMVVGQVRAAGWSRAAPGLAAACALLAWWPLPGPEFDGPFGQRDPNARGLAMLHARLAPYGTEKLQGVFGLDEAKYLLPDELRDVGQSGETVYLLGDAQGFLYPVPATRLRYRTVFDLPGDAADMYAAWLGGETVAGPVVMHPAEVERLSRTYYKVPGLPPALRERLRAEKGPRWAEPYVERR